MLAMNTLELLLLIQLGRLAVSPACRQAKQWRKVVGSGHWQTVKLTAAACADRQVENARSPHTSTWLKRS